MSSPESGGPMPRLRQLAPVMSLTLVAALTVGSTLYLRERSNLIQQAEDELLLLMNLRTSALEHWFETTRSELILWSDHGPLRENLEGFKEAWTSLGSRPGSVLRRLYVDENPHPVGQRQDLDDPGDGSAYSALHSDLQPEARYFLASHGYYDVFLCDPAGDVLYSFHKEEDFAANLLTAEWRETGLGRAFRAARDASARDFFALTDLDRYAPSQDQPALFFASPMRDRASGELLGVLAMQMSAAPLTEIMQFTAGMGETGETYVVGGDLLMRSDSRFSAPSEILQTAADTEPVRRALAGESGVQIATDYRGERVVAAFGPLGFEGVSWAVIAEKDLEEILRPAKRLGRLLLVVGVLATALVVTAGALGAFDSAPRPASHRA